MLQVRGALGQNHIGPGQVLVQLQGRMSKRAAITRVVGIPGHVDQLLSLFTSGQVGIIRSPVYARIGSATGNDVTKVGI